jgi:hypothetical protein
MLGGFSRLESPFNETLKSSSVTAREAYAVIAWSPIFSVLILSLVARVLKWQDRRLFVLAGSFSIASLTFALKLSW